MLYNLSDDYENILDLEHQLHDNTKTLVMVLNTFKTGFFSHSSEVALMACRVMVKFGKVCLDGNIAKGTQDWFTNLQQDGGITAVLYVLKRHPQLIEMVVQVILTFSKGKLTYVLRDLLKNLYPSPLEYATMVNDFVFIIDRHEEAKNELLEHGLIDQWLELCVRQADNDGKHSPEERISAIALLADLWTLFPEKLGLREDLQNQIVAMYKRGSKDKNKALRFTTLTQMFRLVVLFSEQKNPVAPQFYKNISHALIENHADATSREFTIGNL